MIGNGGWALVADGEKALFLENRGDADLPDLRIIRVEENPLDENRDVYSDDEGRRVDNHGTGQRSAMERTDYKRIEKERFATEIAGILTRALRRGALKELAVIAPPQALGALRSDLSKEVAAKVVAEVPKDYAHLPTDQLEAQVTAVLSKK